MFTFLHPRFELFYSTTINLNKQGNFKIIKFALLILEFLFLFFIWALNF